MPLKRLSVRPSSGFEMLKMRIFSISSVSVLVTRYWSPRHVPSSSWKSLWCMMTLICSVSFRSSAATIDSIVDTASDEISAVSLSACCRQGADRRLHGVLGGVGPRLEFLLKQVIELGDFECSAWTLGLLLRRHGASSSRGLGLRLGVRPSLGGLGGGGQCLEQRRVLEHLA